MPSTTLLPKEEKPVAVTGLYLSIVNASAKFTVKSPGIGVLVGEMGRQFELPQVRQVEFVNDSDEPVIVEYETSNIKVHTSGKGVVSVENEIVVKRIVEAIQVSANATVDNGKMAMLPAKSSQALNDLVIPANQTRLFAPARPDVTNRKVTVQTVTQNAQLSMLRLGANADLGAGQGIVLVGNINAMGGYEFDTEQAVYIHNESDFDAKVAGGEVWR